MISAVHLLDGADIPVLGVNLGSLGFMTAVAAEDLEDAVDAVAAGQFTLSTRTMASCEVTPREGESACYTALNDMVLGWGASSRLVSLGLRINGERVTSYDCDGLIISTPTGSTGHSLSAGGPVLHPETQALLVNVICPHALSARPLVVPDTNRLDVILENAPSDKQMLLAVDGQQQAELGNDAVITVRKHPTGVRFLHPPGYSYFEVLRRKLHWRGSTL
jgi:NAD+ kinase